MGSRFEREIQEILEQEMRRPPRRRGWLRRAAFGWSCWWRNLRQSLSDFADSWNWVLMDPSQLMLWAYGLLVMGWLARGIMGWLGLLLSLVGVVLFALAYVLAITGFPPRRRRVKWRGRIIELPSQPSPWERWRQWWRSFRQRR